MREKGGGLAWRVSAALVVWVCCVAATAAARTSITDLRCEYRQNPLGIDALKPRLSWVINSSERGQLQTAYQVLAASSAEKLMRGKGDLWDTGRVSSDQSIQV